MEGSFLSEVAPITRKVKWIEICLETPKVLVEKATIQGMPQKCLI